MRSKPMKISILVAALAITNVLAPPLANAETYGDGVTLEETTPITTILADPAAWKGQRVRVEGTVTDVCPKKGCWMSLRDDEERAIRIKVDDDVIVFPAAAKTKHASAEGVVQVIDLDRDRYASWLEHLAEERGEVFDPASVGDGPYQLVQIQGAGAEIDL